MPSLKHCLLARVIPRVRPGAGQDVRDPDQLRRDKLAAQAAAETGPPRRVTTTHRVESVDGYGFPVYSLTVRGSQPRRSVLYLHGGGYVDEADGVHWKYCARLAQRMDARVLLPRYPLAPEHTWRASHPQMLSLFDQIAIESPAGVTVIGDSAGGGYALALAEQLNLRSGPQPTHVVLISPWLDITNSTPGTDEANRRDPWLNLSRLDLAGRWWAGSDDRRCPEVSPLYGELSGLPPTLMFCGTLDTLYPQCRELVRLAGEAGWDLTYVEEPDLLHVYPILPVPEARKALNQTVEFVSRP